MKILCILFFMLINANVSFTQCVENSHFKFLEINISKNSKEKHISIKSPRLKTDGLVNITDDRTVFLCILKKIDCGKSYCDLVYGAMKGNKECIVILSKVNVGDFASYQHGVVLIDINKLSEKEYLKIISQLNEKEKKAAYYSYVWAGLEFTPNPKYKKKHIEKVFPELTKELK